MACDTFDSNRSQQDKAGFGGSIFEFVGQCTDKHEALVE